MTRERVINKNLVVSERWYDAEGNPMSPTGDTYCSVEYTYDKSGNINREKYYDPQGEPIRCNAGYAIVYREYDTQNRVVYEKFFDTDGFAIMLEDGAVSYRYTYDEDGNLVKRTKYDYGDWEIE